MLRRPRPPALVQVASVALAIAGGGSARAEEPARPPSPSAPIQVRSDGARASVLELYTSEGCSSCPPADDLVNRLPLDPAAPVYPLAFHVDYWDEIGWPDPFASARWTERQQARLGRLYTPALVLDGREVVGRAIPNVRAPAAARLILTLDGDRARVQAEGGHHVYVALAESGLTVDVRAGENRGRRLRHDHVVRTLWGPLDAAAVHDFRVAPDPTWQRGALALVAWVEDARGAVVNAVRLPLAPASPHVPTSSPR